MIELTRRSCAWNSAMDLGTVGGVMGSWNKAAATIGAIALAFAASAAAKDAPGSRKLTIEQLIDIKHPSDPLCSPGGAHVVFKRHRAGDANLYLANADGHSQ